MILRNSQTEEKKDSRQNKTKKNYQSCSNICKKLRERQKKKHRDDEKRRRKVEKRGELEEARK